MMQPTLAGNQSYTRTTVASSLVGNVTRELFGMQRLWAEFQLKLDAVGAANNLRGLAAKIKFTIILLEDSSCVKENPRIPNLLRLSQINCPCS